MSGITGLTEEARSKGRATLSQKAKEIREERTRKILAVLTANSAKGVWTSKQELADTIAVDSIKALDEFMRQHFLPNHPEILKRYRLGFLIDPTIKKENPMKNPEGYSDHTAGKAIANMGKALAGEVWEYEYKYTGGTRTELVLVISSSKDVMIVLKLYPDETPACLTTKTMITLRVGNDKYMVDAALPCWKPAKYFVRKIGEVTPTQMAFVKKALSRAFAIPVETKIVEKPVDRIKMIEKPVEKIVEVPVEKIVEKVVEIRPEDDPEIAVLRAEHAIYKSIVDRLLGKVTVDAV